MNDAPTMHQRQRWRRATHEDLREHQIQRLNELLLRARLQQPFYADRLKGISLPLMSLDELDTIPLLTKSDLLPGIPATICGLQRDTYTRAHQTSGTTGSPILMLDTEEDWRWWLSCWQFVLDAADVTAADTAFMAFSYGPFIGFWSAHEAMVCRGALVVPGGGMTSLARLHAIAASGATVVCCTPTYALHLATTAKLAGLTLSKLPVSRIIVAGEAGGSISEVRLRIESAWDARVIDHCGATEVGAWGYGDRNGEGIYGIESEFIVERIVFDGVSGNGRRAVDGELAELVLTGLGRHGAPAIRYRTGDLVRAEESQDPDHQFVFLRGGIIGRADDMVVIRGVNVFPSSVEAIVRRVCGDAEYRVNRSRHQEMDQLRIEIEGDIATANRLHDAFRERLGLRMEVSCVDPGTLPRSDAKANRWFSPSHDEPIRNRG